MPKNKFDAFYYGIGMKLDEASIDQAGKQLEGKLNKVVDSVADNLTSISDAIAKGVKDVDTKKLVQSLVDARKELNQFQNFSKHALFLSVSGSFVPQFSNPDVLFPRRRIFFFNFGQPFQIGSSTVHIALRGPDQFFRRLLLQLDKSP